MFTPIGSSEATLTVFFDGRPLQARAGETIAACLLRAGVAAFRHTPVSGTPRLPYCMIGHCFDCLVEIEGVGSRQACLCPVEPGMRLRTQNGSATIEGLVLGEDDR
ncbi:(2Fe-2S)-binding protein [Agrobacterium sp. fls2-241-TYG-188a]|uniref:(2Fe-2S)-binding protein n=1 Tax=Agrobacterium sp. fls2-241-TYG-188a TaxID=3040275 RepID=UPI000DDFC827|nr:(2Fe-2S)-binding protein [Agrobacterium sp. fls2-241-TYG-188a]